MEHYYIGTNKKVKEEAKPKLLKGYTRRVYYSVTMDQVYDFDRDTKVKSTHFIYIGQL